MPQLRLHIAVLLSSLILLASAWQASIIVTYYLNQEKIIKEHCINKDEPEKKCHGKCHLKKMLGQKEKVDDSNERNLSVNTFLIFRGFENISFDIKHGLITYFKENNFHYSALKGTNLIRSVFIPPDQC